MKALFPYALIAALVLFLAASHNEYEQEVEEERIEQQLQMERIAEAHADSLGLTGQDRINFINNYSNGN